MHDPESGESTSPALGKPQSTDSGTSYSAGNSASTYSAPKIALHVCSYCGKSFDRAESKHMPFCSRRCQHIDLGMWLNEAYGLPHEGESSLDSYGVQDEND